MSRTATEEARRTKNIDGKPAGSTVCRRCKGYGRGKAWSHTGDDCFRCSGYGYCLNGEDLAALCTTEARALLVRIEAGGKAATGLDLENKRAHWVRTRAAVRALGALAGTSPTLTAVRAAAGKFTSLPTTRR